MLSPGGDYTLGQPELIGMLEDYRRQANFGAIGDTVSQNFGNVSLRDTQYILLKDCEDVALTGHADGFVVGSVGRASLPGVDGDKPSMRFSRNRIASSHLRQLPKVPRCTSLRSEAANRSVADERSDPRNVAAVTPHSTAIVMSVNPPI